MIIVKIALEHVKGEQKRAEEATQITLKNLISGK